MYPGIDMAVRADTRSDWLEDRYRGQRCRLRARETFAFPMWSQCSRRSRPVCSHGRWFELLSLDMAEKSPQARFLQSRATIVLGSPRDRTPLSQASLLLPRPQLRAASQ